jgi:glycosyltransferase involved in cell wall biosynthesis
MLAEAGHTLTFHPLPRQLFGRLAIGKDLVHADVVILQRKLFPTWVLSRLRRRVKRLVFDFDDALWLRDSFSPRGFDDPSRSLRFRTTVAACDAVVAGCATLAEEAKRWVSPDRVRIVPTCVDVAKYPLADHDRDHGGLQLVWVGSSSTLQALERFSPTLSAIGKAVPGTRLKLVCDRFLTIPNLPVDECVWAESTETTEIAAADVGIGYVPDDPWSRGKCGLKLLQYHAAGLPVIANPVGVQADIVRNGVTGFQATTTEDWIAAVRRLHADRVLRKRIGDAGRRQVEAAYSVEAGAKMWLAMLDELAFDSRRKCG